MLLAFNDCGLAVNPPRPRIVACRRFSPAPALWLYAKMLGTLPGHNSLFSYISSVLALYAVAACQAKVAFPVFAAVNQGGDMLQRPAFPGPYLPATLAA